MGKCVRIRGSSKPPPAEDKAGSWLTLRSGRRVLPAVACRPRTSGRPRRHRAGSALLWCSGAEAATATANKLPRACGGGSPRRRSAGRVLGAQRLCGDGRRPEAAEVPPPLRAADTGADDDVVRGGVDHGLGDSFERPKTPLMTDGDHDAAVAKEKAKQESESHHRKGDVVAGQTPSLPPTEAEIEAFFAVAELAERRRFAEAYNYDVALDHPMEGRFEWAPVSNVMTGDRRRGKTVSSAF